MLPVTETVFWICFMVIFYTYAGYPILLLILVYLKKIFTTTPGPKEINNFHEPVTLLVAAYNEQDVIEEKIKNCFELDYPTEKLKILFITDGSTDNTVSIIKKYPLARNLHQPERKGKLAAMNRAMQFVDTDFVIFTDANTLLNRESLTKIMSHYADPNVGGVAGEKKIVISKDGAVARGEGVYWKYESFLKNLDSQLYTTVGAAGELFSMRSALYSTLPGNIIIEDFIQSLLLCDKGYMVKYEPGAFSLEKASFSIKDEMERKIRISAGGFQAIIYLKKLLNVFRYPTLSFQYISHRVLRWTLCPVALGVLFINSFMVWWERDSPFFGFFTLLQAVFYLMALAGWLISRNNRDPGIFYLPFYFVFMNCCVFAGFMRFVRGKQGATWQKALRSKI